MQLMEIWTLLYALLLAHDQWGSDGEINYLIEANRIIINGLKTSNTKNYRMMLGDWWIYGDWEWATRISDWMPGHFHAYSNATGDNFWNEIADTVYNMIDHLSLHHSPTTGLMPDFADQPVPVPAQPNFLESEYDGHYNWNACRFPWRIAVDYAHHGTPGAKTAIDKVVNWIKNETLNNPANIKPGYQLNGQPIPGRFYTSQAFTSPFIAACIVNELHQEYLNIGWDIIKDTKETYYGDTINLLCMLLISGNWWAPGEGNNSHIGDSMKLEKIPSTIFLLPNFPNPFNPITIISYGLSEDTHVTLRIYNTLGQEVITLVDEYQQAGYKTVVWTGSDKLGFKINSGIYFYQLKAGNFRDIKTMICLH